LAVLVCGPTFAAGKGRNRTTDTTAPSVTISAPTSGSTTGSSLTVTGSASDNVGVSAVSLQVDGGVWQPANGTTSWSVPLQGFPAGSHSVTAKAADAAGNTRTATTTFTVSSTSTTPSPAPTPTQPTPSPSPTQPAPSPSPTSPSPTTPPPSGPAPDTQGTWTSPEGAVIDVHTAGSFTIAQVYQLLLDASAGPGDFAQVAPTLTVRVQDTYPSQTTSSASGAGGAYTSFRSTVYLKGDSGSFATQPHACLTHEFGHAWTSYHLYLDHNGDWGSYLSTRWSTSDGSTRIAQDSRLGTAYEWSTDEIAADDYRMLFGSATALSERPNHLNTWIVDPRNQPGLKSWFLSTWK
jgi:hypothetical protein